MSYTAVITTRELHNKIVLPRILRAKMYDQDEDDHSCKEMGKWQRIFHHLFV